MSRLLGGVVAAALLLSAHSATAQELDLALTEERRDEVGAWVEQAQEWFAWAQVWYNRVQPGSFGGVRDRKPRPPAPSWLPEYCTSRTSEDHPDEIFVKACELNAQITDFVNGHPVRRQTTITRAAEEQDKSRTRFPERLHLDAMWTVTQFGGSTPIGLIGAHLALFELGRVALYGPPGFLLVLWPEGNERTLKPAYSWGVSIRLTDFDVFGTDKRAVLHLNLSKVWVQGVGSLPSSTGTSMDMAGFSMTWKNP
jgi:hypothetical protein